MTSQHFAADEGKGEWDWEDGDWGDSGHNNNNSVKSQVTGQPPVQVRSYKVQLRSLKITFRLF